MMFLRAIFLISFSAIFSSNLFAAQSSAQLGFWEISIAGVEAGEPFMLKSPTAGKGDDFFLVWPYRFKTNISLQAVKKHLQNKLDKVGDDRRTRELLQRSLKKVDAGMLKKISGMKLYISVLTDDGKSYQDIASPLIRNIVEKKLGKRLYTSIEIAAQKFDLGKEVEGVAIFPEIDRNADRFSIRVSGLGKRLIPSYYPMHIRKIGLPYAAKLRKVAIFRYERPGDASMRVLADIRFAGYQTQWEWMWANEIFPYKSKKLAVERRVTTANGEEKLIYNYRYFVYDIFNSTPDERKIEVRAAGISSRVKWQGMIFRVNMQEDAQGTNFRKSQALRQLAGVEPDFFAEGKSRHVSGKIAPGLKRSGLAVLRWGIEDAEQLLRNAMTKLRLTGSFGNVNKKSELLSSYCALSPAGSDKLPLLQRSALPGDEVVKGLILAQAEKDLQTSKRIITVSEKRRYGQLAPFAVLINDLADKEIERLETGGRASVFFTVSVNNTQDSASFVRLTDIGRPVEKKIDTSISAVALKAGDDGGGEEDEGKSDKAEDGGDDTGDGGDDLW